VAELEAVHRHKERLTESRKRAVRLNWRREERCTGAQGPGGVLETWMLWEMNEEEMMWYLPWYNSAYIPWHIQLIYTVVYIEQ
jgi:hypothetical protein